MLRFKIGDTVKLTHSNEDMYSDNCYNGKLEHGHIGKVTEASYGVSKVDNEKSGCNISNSQLQLVFNMPKTVPHKHAELIKAWADGAEIQMYSTGQLGWHDLEQPSWAVGLKYRIKPTKTNKEIKLEEMEETARKLAEKIKAFRNE
jgi:hypothetical protein